jgi:hypothetical protein
VEDRRTRPANRDFGTGTTRPWLAGADLPPSEPSRSGGRVSLEGSFAEAARRPRAGQALNRHVKRKKDLLIKVMVPTQTLG